METKEIENGKAKNLCDLGICRSMGEARRIVALGSYEHIVEIFEKKRKEHSR
jgi:hypothetical protein